MRLPFCEYHLIQALNYFEINSYPLDLALHYYFRLHKALGSKDRAFVANNLYSLMRWKNTLDWFSTFPFSWEKRWRLYKERSIEDLQSKTSFPPYISVGFPEWLFAKLEEEYGFEQAKKLCLVSNTQGPSTIRANLIKTTRSDLFDHLKVNFEIRETDKSPHGIVFTKRLNYFELPAYKEGLFEVQDEGSQLLAELVDPSPGEHVLDFCAGSGGKTLAFAHKLKKRGQIYLHDTRLSVLQKARKRLSRAGVQNVQFIENASLKLNCLSQKMDWVLIDVPCSGTGTLRRNPDMKWRLQGEDVMKRLDEQKGIFEQAFKFLKRGGKIVYATCSLLQEENERQVDHFIAHYPIKIFGQPLKLLPELNGHDGFFGVVFQKC